MAKVSKFMKINPNILMEWTWDNEHYVTENYKIITNLNENKKRSFLSTVNLNNYKNNLFQLDSVLRKYTLLDTSRYNFLQEQDYNSAPVPYDTVKIYLPTSYNFVFNGYVGLYMKIFTYGFHNSKIFELSNIFFDATSSSSSGMTNLAIPFIYDEQEWGKYYEFDIPSIDFISNQRSGSTNSAIINSINYNLTNGEGLSQNAPIFIDFQFLNSKDSATSISPVFYYSSESYRSSFPKAPEYNTLAVKIDESTEGDFFEIYGTYGDSNENLDNFIESIRNKGRNVRIEYDIYLYEENIQTNMQTVVVAGGTNDDFTKKILYRPVLTFSNTTAVIKVNMRVIDLVDMSTIERYTSIGLKDNIQKYGKKLLSLNVQNLNKLKIYNSKPDEIVLGKDYFSGNLITEIIKVYSPQLIEVGKIVVNSPSSVSDYRGMGLLNIVITPFDNIIQFRLAIIPQTNQGSNSQYEQYDLSAILNTSEIVLNFKSDTESIDKSIYNEADNDYKNGIVNFKIVENDLNVLRKIYSKGYNNFYLTILSKELKSKTLLYSGTFSFYEDITFFENESIISDISSENIQPPGTGTTPDNTGTTPDWPKPGRTVIIYTKYKDTTN
jgi:hypothetical protein